MLVQIWFYSKVSLHHGCNFQSFVEFEIVDQGLWPIHVWNVEDQWMGGRLGDILDTYAISLRVWSSGMLELVHMCS